MAIQVKKDMLQQTYSWKDSDGDNPQADVQKVEALIGSELPGNVRGRKKVFDWLVGRLA